MSQEVLKIAARYDEQIKGMEDKAIARLNRALETAYGALEKDLVKSYNNISSNATLLQSQRRALIFRELGGLLQIVNPDKADSYEAIFGEILRDTTNAGFDVAGLFAQALGNEKLKPLSDIAIEAVAASAKGTYQRLLRYGDNFADTATNIISQGIVQGWGIQRVLQPLQQQLGVTKSRAESIARYEAIAAYNDAAVQRYSQADIEWVTWVAISDKIICGYCLARHLQTYRLSDGIRPPIHPRCRCTQMPLKKAWVDAGIVEAEFYRVERQKALANAEITPIYQPASFEKQAGIKRLPEPAWEP